MIGAGSPGYVVIPCSIEWLRSMRGMLGDSAYRLLFMQLQVDSCHRTDPGDRFSHLVVGRGGTRSDPDDPGVSQPIGSDRLRFRADRLMPNCSRGHGDGPG